MKAAKPFLFILGPELLAVHYIGNSDPSSPYITEIFLSGTSSMMLHPEYSSPLQGIHLPLSILDILTH